MYMRNEFLAAAIKITYGLVGLGKFTEHFL